MNKKQSRLVLLAAIAFLALVVVGCSSGSADPVADTRLNFTEDFALIPFDLNGDGTIDDGEEGTDPDGDETPEIVNAGGGRVLTYDPNGDGTPDLVDGKILRLVSGRFGDGVTVEFTDDAIWYLNGTVFIGENDAQTDATRPDSTVLEIEAGTTILGIASASNPGLLVIDRNGQIDAVGTASAPIVMSSSKAAGSRAPGDWGGLVINGNALVQGGTVQGEGGTGTYGGTIADDDSGSIEYLRVEFAGTLFTPDNELNGIAFQAVGSGTTVDHIQVHKNADDGVEFFGGSVAVKHVVLTGIQDDALDYDDGWDGSAQFVIIHQYGDGDKAIEADGDEEANDAADNPLAPADPVLANFTMIGAAGDAGPNFKSDAEGELWNSIIVNYTGTDRALAEATSAQPTIAYRGVGIEAAVNPNSDAVDWAAQVGSNGNFYSATAGSVATGLDASLTAPDFVPATLGGATAQTLPTEDEAGNAITAAAYLGAINAGGTDWTSGWTAFPEN